MPALMVDTSAHLRAAHPRAICYKCYNESNFPHHKARAREGNRSTRGIFLRRDPSRLGEMLARSESQCEDIPQTTIPPYHRSISTVRAGVGTDLQEVRNWFKPTGCGRRLNPSRALSHGVEG
ncbi:hypothetical protein DEO72_LG7g1857 [Vigna unguiculata]|uniref:Uncharacterized protein n=1 Tax=Vigna unguiculata TaxID=3917 RepID=A0A4D6MKN5_VIGUN|nr:hypothetical protein DEO72_LG7g1857 [Vigna unguiculata]